MFDSSIHCTQMANKQTNKQTYIHTYIHSYIHTYIPSQQTYIHSYIQTYIYAYIHTDTHTDTRKRKSMLHKGRVGTYTPNVLLNLSCEASTDDIYEVHSRRTQELHRIVDHGNIHQGNQGLFPTAQKTRIPREHPMRQKNTQRCWAVAFHCHVFHPRAKVQIHMHTCVCMLPA